ncbi:MAG: glycogen/starch synthase [Gemmatimonadales bacterium]|jgi:starch synthase
MSSYTVVHLVAEYWPFAQTGGLADAARGMAHYQGEAGIPSITLLPLYRAVAERYPGVSPCGEPFSVSIADRVETVRLHQPDFEPDRFADDGSRTFFIENAHYFDRAGIYGDASGDFADNHRRFALFCRAALQAVPQITSGRVLLHAHDWHTAWAPVYLRTLLSGQSTYDGIPAVITVHNAGFQGHVPFSVLADVGLPDELFHHDRMEWYGQVNVLKGGLVFSDMATTVSSGHAHELRTRAGGFGLDDTFIALQDRFVGIVNGIDDQIWDPSTDTDIEANYSKEDLAGKAECKAWLQEACGLKVDPRIPLVAMVARMVAQKGLDLILSANLLGATDAQYLFLGSGERRYEEALAALAARAPSRIAAYFDFTHARERQLLAGADVLLMPSLYEPCGLTQMRALRYGTLPVARRVGGLADTIEDQMTGFLFDTFEPAALERGLKRAFGLFEDSETWRRHVREAMTRDFSWSRSVERYLEVYESAFERRSRQA